MYDVIVETIIDSVKILPFLFVAFLIIEYIEHKLNNKKIIEKAGKVGPIVGGVLGIIPQCGFSVLATNLYVTRIISLGTLIAVYLSTSDEMLPILIAEGSSFNVIIKILLLKLIIGIFWGFIIDFIFQRKEAKTDFHICDEHHCDCEKGLVKSSLIHTLKTITFIFIITFILNTLFHFIGEDTLKNIFHEDNVLTPFLASLIGLIPNCAASVTLTELYLSGVLNLGSALAGLLTSSGVALLVLFKSNKNIKENILITILIYGIGVISGLIIQFLNL